MPWESGRTRRTLLQVASESKAKSRPLQAFFLRLVPEYFCTHQTLSFSAHASVKPCIRATPCPHTGQSSQFFADAKDGSDQLLSTSAGNALIRQAIHVAHRLTNPLEVAHSGQSSQLPFDANARNGQFLPTVVRSLSKIRLR
jgi:hypothetical protein